MPRTTEFTHYDGLNIQALVIHNETGAVLSIAKNAIHESEDPTRHAEPSALHGALIRMHELYPRASGTTVEDYYRSHLFYASGKDEYDYARRGCSLYTTLEPCPMCASTLCVARMKQVVFVIDDKKYGGGFLLVQQQFYKSYDLRYRQLGLTNSVSPLIDAAEIIRADILTEVARLRAQGVQDIWFLDRLHANLAAALDLLVRTTETDLVTTADERVANAVTLSDLKRLCRLPS